MPHQAACLQAWCRHPPLQVAASIQQNQQSGQPPDLQPPAHKSSAIITWDYDSLFAASERQPESQGLLSIQSTPSMCGTTDSLHISLRTSKPLSRLVKASFNPLVADEIFSSTMLINERWPSKREACSRRSVSVSGRSPNYVGPFLSPPVGAERSGFRVAEVLAFGLGKSGLLRDDISGSPVPWGREAGGVSLSIISGRRSPEDELCREGLRSELQDICFGYCPQK